MRAAIRYVFFWPPGINYFLVVRNRPFSFVFSMRVLIALLFLVPAGLFAHPGHAAGPLSGLWHPFTGLDHLLVMVAVGFVASRLGGKVRLFAPAAFLLAMISGASASWAGVSLPGVEPLVQLSLAVFGVLLMAGFRMHSGFFLVLVGVAGFFHGAAHASEGPAAISYAIGFLASTAALHVAGLLLGNIQTRAGSVLSRAVGAAMIALAMAG